MVAVALNTLLETRPSQAGSPPPELSTAARNALPSANSSPRPSPNASSPIAATVPALRLAAISTDSRASPVDPVTPGRLAPSTVIDLRDSLPYDPVTLPDDDEI